MDDRGERAWNNALQPSWLISLYDERDRMRAEVERLRAENAVLIEDRARFPDRPDGIGRMIEAHTGNLKLGKEAADGHARHAMDKAARLRALLQRHDDLCRKDEDTGVSYTWTRELEQLVNDTRAALAGKEPTP